jgi:glycosyltransferase involved in cell wall biosynthesis
MKIYCVIPAYNEEKTILEVVNSVKKYVDEIIIVDDGSIDKTYELAKTLNVNVLQHIINRGQGAALQTGTEYALRNGADIIVHFDADGQFLAEDINEVVEPIKSGKYDVVFGSRFLDRKSQIPWAKRNIIMPLARLVNKVFVGINLTDPQSGFRAYTREVALKIKIKQDGMAHCSEILQKVTRNDFKIKEVPIKVIYNNFGQRFSGGIKILKELLIGALIR